MAGLWNREKTRKEGESEIDYSYWKCLPTWNLIFVLDVVRLVLYTAQFSFCNGRLIDWFIWCLTPYRQYFIYLMKVVFKRYAAWTQTIQRETPQFQHCFFLPMYSTRNTYTKSNVVMTCIFVDWWEIYPYQWRPRSRPRGSRRQRESRHDCDGITWFGNNPEDAVRKRQFLRHVSCVSSGHCLPAIVQRTSISY